MTELAGHRVCAVHELTVQQQPDADALRDGHRDQVTHVLGVAAEPELASAQAFAAFSSSTGRPIAASIIRRDPRRPSRGSARTPGVRLVDAPGQADAHAFARQPRVCGPQRA